MKNTKRIATLILMLVLAVTSVVIPVYAAAEENKVMPLYAVAPCPDCGEDARYLGIERDAYIVYLQVPCDIHPDGYHLHSFIIDVANYACPNCGSVAHYIYRNEHCPFE